MEPTTLDEVMIDDMEEMYPEEILDIIEDDEDITLIMDQEAVQEAQKLF